VAGEAAVEYMLPQGDGSFRGGPVADRLLAVNFDTGALRPWTDKWGRTWMTLWNERLGKKQNVLVSNSPSGLPYDGWRYWDDSLVRVMRQQLTVYGDIVGQGLSMNIPNAMGTPVIMHQTMTDAGEADLSMDGIRQTKRDQTIFDLQGLPIPLVHSDFDFSLRDLEMSRNPGRGGVVMPKDTTMIEQSTRKCMEKIEKFFLGTLASYSFAGFTAYGLTNYPYRTTRTLTLPTAAGWTPETTYGEIMDMIQDAHNVLFYGPYMIWYSPAWFRYFNADYSSAQPSAGVLNDRLARIPNIKFWHQADFLGAGYTILLVQVSPAVIQALNGIKLHVMQWDAVGGLVKNYKVLGCMVPRLRRNANGNTGIVHGVAA
jgi:hypothetical protein